MIHWEQAATLLGAVNVIENKQIIANNVNMGKQNNWKDWICQAEFVGGFSYSLEKLITPI